MAIADLAPTAELADLRARYRAFMEEHVYPNEQALETDDALVAELQARAKSEGLWAPHVPPDAGGTGLSIVQALVRDELQGRLDLRSEGGTRAEVVFPQ